MTSENQALLDAIRVIVGDAVAPLTKGVEGLSGRMDGIEVEQRAQRGLLESIDSRLTSVETRLTSVETRLTTLERHVTYLDERYETLDARTSQIAQDLFDLGERMDKGFAAIRSDLRVAFHEIVELQTGQKGQTRRIKALEEKVSELQQRLEKLESRQISG